SGVCGEFDEEEREQLRHIFLKLVRPGQGTEDTRQVASVGQIAKEYRGLITRLADKRLLVTGRDEERGEETVEVVHEALIRRWQTLRQWVDEEREFLVWQEKLQVLLGQWVESGKDEGALLRGLPLDEALKWRVTHDAHLTDEEREFIAASETLRKKEQQAREEKMNMDRETQLILEASYYRAKLFEEKALTAWRKAQNDHSNKSYQEAVIFTSAALSQEIEPKKSALKSSSVDILFVFSVFRAGLAELSILKGHEGSVYSVDFNSNSQALLASASYDKTVRLWDIGSGRELAVFKGHEKGVNSVSFSPDGRMIASASDDKSIRLWEIASGKELIIFKGHRDTVNHVVFSLDGRRLASAASDKTIRLWSSISGKQLAVFKGHKEKNSFSVSFAPDGKALASGSRYNTVRIWDIISSKVGDFWIATALFRTWCFFSNKSPKLLKKHGHLVT
ncbi:MAG: myosin kinase, partial [Candidatus Electrothrix sp. MAN1_4]|nr:myosin kinase [Candidatus Electrothrix sp. MAN1_4]